MVIVVVHTSGPTTDNMVGLWLTDCLTFNNKSLGGRFRPDLIKCFKSKTLGSAAFFQDADLS